MKKGIDHTNRKKKKSKKYSYYMAVGMSVGLLFGTLYSVFTHTDMITCEGTGICIGILLGLAFAQCK